MKRIVIGTAGHIDHGKTALIRSLTGIDCDRLKEEKERGITTELGFAHYRIGSDLLVGIVDVPGHERFIRHMVAGAWGIDMVLFVIAADEGVMPQTREHMDICDMLGVSKGIMVITKTDLVDADMVDLVREDVKDFVAGRPLEHAPVIAVSANTGEGMDALKEQIADIAQQIEERSREGIFRLPVDRIFTIRGLGTVVTGTCISGSVRTGDEIEIFPLSIETRVKNVQAYHEDAHEAIAGQRVALNLQSVEKNDITRGVIIGRPGTLMYSHRVDASLKYLKLPFKPIKNDTILRLHIAATQVEARLVILDRDAIEPGEELFVQFVFKEPLVALPGDRFILRGSYAIQTIGGGRIVDIMPRRHRRKMEGLQKTYAVLSGNDDLEKILYHTGKFEFAGIDEGMLSILIGKDNTQTRELIQRLTAAHKVRVVGRMVLQEEMFKVYRNQLFSILKDFVDKNPLKAGMSKEELRTRLPKTDANIFQNAIDEMIRDSRVEVEKDKVKIRDSSDTAQSRKSGDADNVILKTLMKYGLATPSLRELATETGKTERDLRDILNRLSFEGRIVKLKGEMYFHSEAIEGLKKSAVTYLKSHKEMTPSDFKSVVDVSRKYMIPLLEYLDSIKLTIRVGDKRVLRS